MSEGRPICNLLVIRSKDMERAVAFYEMLGMSFSKHSHGKGPMHYASDEHGFVFEIYPARSESDDTTSTRLGFQVADVDCVVNRISASGATIRTSPADTEWGRRAVVRDFDGHTVELVTPVEQYD